MESKLGYIKEAQYTFRDHTAFMSPIEDGEHIDCECNHRGADMVGVLIVAIFAGVFGFLIGFAFGRM